MQHRGEQATLNSGAHVQSEDGKDLGTVGEVIGDYFEVLRGDEPGYWLNRETVVESSEDVARVDFPEDDLVTQIVRDPPTRYEESEYLNPLSGEERHQREVMLDELSEQRDEIREEGRATEEADDTVGIPVEEELKRIREGSEPGDRAPDG